uniref:Uncharacterized protein n=1 Tax=Zea mays TaxID=4577 RepID=B6TWX4_MAIZE|nr:hypothetical protein [Zea mays]
MATSYGSMANPPITSRTPFLSKQASNWIPATISNGNGTGGMFTVQAESRGMGSNFVLSLETQALAMCLM